MARGSFFRNMTDEEKKEFHRQRVTKIRAKNERLKVENYPIHPDTDSYWAELAKERGIRLPHRTTPLTRSGLVGFLHKLDIGLGQHREWVGLKMKEYIARNASHFPLRAAVGFALEHQTAEKA